VRVVLEREGFRVLEAENGMEALAVFEGAEPPPDVLLTDVVMPQMGGKELAKRLQAARPGLQVIFMSGFVRDSELLEGLNDRKAPFLQKPFDIEELARVVKVAAGSDGKR
jgi:two-component system cell cycle sensor histidine kinase/response regulator CckA